MSEALALFDILISAERSEHERLEALNSLQPFLETDEAVEKLAAAARAENTLSVRARMLEYLVNIPLTRLSQREALTDTLSWFACLEPERPLRLLAIEALSNLAAHLDSVQEILADTLVNDLDPVIQQVCLDGLSKIVNISADTITKVSEFIALAPASVKPGLFNLVKRFPTDAAATLALQFLSPLETRHTREAAIAFLASLPAPSATVIENLSARFISETDLSIRAAIIQLLSDLREIDTTLFTGIFAALQKAPDQPELLALIRDRLVAHPELQTALTQLFAQTPSAGLKIRVLSLLAHCEVPELLITALNDKNPYVREAAISYLEKKFVLHQDLLEPALAAAVKQEPLLALRGALINVLLNSGRKSAATLQLLTELAVAETDHFLKTQLINAVLEVPVTPANKAALLQLFREVLEANWYPDHTRNAVIERLKTFSYSDSPDLKRSLGLLLEQSKDIRELAATYGLLKTLEADFSELAPAITTSLYRHIAYYPQSPLDEWVQLLGKLAATDASVRAQLPHIVSLTKANWLLSDTDKADQTGAFLPAFRQTLMKKNGMQTFMEAERMLQDAWQNRTIKKAEVIELYKLLLSMPKPGGILHQLLQIMQTGKLVTPELVQISLDYLQYASDKDAQYMVRKYLEGTGFIDPAYRAQLDRLFTPENYAKHIAFSMPTLHSKRRYATLNDWEYQGWAALYSQWPIAELLFALEPGDLINQVFSHVTDAARPEATLPYVVLEHLFRQSGGKWARAIYNDTAQLQSFLTLLYNNIRQLPGGNALRDRMVYVFWKKWNDYARQAEPTREQAIAAAEVYIEVCKVLKRLEPTFAGKQFPLVLNKMDKETLQQQWPWGQEIWELFEAKLPKQ
ncbi:hypothetical protein [Chitinophaga silvisoli]|uniref:HEAT repeat domain-containing protein n=1 Tax=Chitinophaga silvisoli TaxID=2291814 RepID=A0A3E1NTQ5_9BACT|nr:hypothetical protein [Chitinophaga silvisoli]RFM31293.1 hypothetical protein DXN04_29645 [Chitinophaga silvisoli]